MNLNASLYSNGINGIQEHYGVSAQAARVGQATLYVFLRMRFQVCAGGTRSALTSPTDPSQLDRIWIWLRIVGPMVRGDGP